MRVPDLERNLQGLVADFHSEKQIGNETAFKPLFRFHAHNLGFNGRRGQQVRNLNVFFPPGILIIKFATFPWPA